MEQHKTEGSSEVKFHCENPRCKRELDIPKELVQELKSGGEVALYCEICHYLTIIESGRPVDYVPPRATTRWTETFY